MNVENKKDEIKELANLIAPLNKENKKRTEDFISGFVAATQLLDKKDEKTVQME